VLAYDGKLRDRVGPSGVGLGSDGILDGTLTVTLASTGGRTVTRLLLESSAPGSWSTDTATGSWILGVANSLDGVLLNDPVTMAVNFTVTDGSSLTLFASDSGDLEFAPGTALTLSVSFSDGSNASTTLTIQ
jgi:hypothetical protein